ncbi:hypothetical protein F441_03306 [Phytophthora nicotianae CJ01A1]|uniref:Ubiquitin-like protease family profile domain-containing protein n=1 Tax=Phytophthora nicotianae CJ01A1 TaxID=1317063 RepID=W2XLQ2_PHYNI|nr:hypothetical protein F441_03306 [Phytophthora nicotianae CJ01A1]
MASVLEAQNQFQRVYFTLEWIGGVEWQVKDVVPPFTGTCDHTKESQNVFIPGDTGRYRMKTNSNQFIYLMILQLAYKEAVTGMVLGEICIGPEWCMGGLLIAGLSQWLHSSSIISAMLALQQMYPKVGVINPSYHHLEYLERWTPIMNSLSLPYAWTLVLDKRKNVCYMFDALQLKENLATLKSSVQFVIQPILGLKDRITYKEVDWCQQKDNSLCGVWCLVILKLLLAGRLCADNLYDMLPYLRLRYLYKAIGIQRGKPAENEN